MKAINYSMFRFYKGEKENLFDQVKENTAHMFWFYESVFDRDFTKNESSDWYAFFGDHRLGKLLMGILSEEDHDRPTEKKKKQVFELWLQYLFTEKLYSEYSSENWYKTAYYNTTAL